MAKELRGKPVADALTEKLIPRAAALAEQGNTPKLAILRVGARDDDLSYERGALKRCASLGIEVESIVLDADCTQDELMAAIERINSDETIHGCLMFRPLPKTLDEAAACAALDPSKDVDCITSGSLYGVFANRPVGFAPCTAEAVIELLGFYGYDLTGARATVAKAEILVVAAGHIGTAGATSVAPGQVVIDVGINWDDKNNKLAGDVLYDEVAPIVDAITPVPGGVGSVTTAILAKHVIEAAERRA